jgi:peptidoglycan DL-endopeptidase CwlO
MSQHAMVWRSAAVTYSQAILFSSTGSVTGIYIGGNQFIHAPHTGDVVKISSISGWYAATYVGARRVT